MEQHPERPLTDLCLAAVERAVGRPGRWVDVMVFRNSARVGKTATCLAGGYVPDRPRPGERETLVRGERCIATAAPVATRVDKMVSGWSLKIRAPPRA